MEVDMHIPEKVKNIIDVLYDNGFEAFAVGGCVRDMLLNKEPHDWDITTSASPYQVKELFNKTIDTGIEHGTVTVMLGGEGFEVTTYRVDGEYEDNRHPKQVVFTSNLELDLERRDFTINAMAYNDRVGLIDIFNGQSDLDNKIIRCVGNAMERFSEDALRILRAARFSAQLGFEIEKTTIDAMQLLAKNLTNISAERIKSELDKLIMSKHCDRLILMSEVGINKYILPEFDDILATTQENPNHCYDVGIHTLKAMSMIDDISEYGLAQKLFNMLDTSVIDDKKNLLMLKWTMLIHDMGKARTKTIDEDGVAHFKKHPLVSIEIANEIFSRLKFDNFTSDTAKKLIAWHDYRFEPEIKPVRRAISKLGEEYVNFLFIVQRADVLGQNPDTFDEKFNKLIKAYDCYKEIKLNNQCLSIKDLKVNGKDLIEAGLKPGPIMGEIMNRLLECVIEEPLQNEKENLIKKAIEYSK